MHTATTLSLPHDTFAPPDARIKHLVMRGVPAVHIALLLEMDPREVEAWIASHILLQAHKPNTLLAEWCAAWFAEKTDAGNATTPQLLVFLWERSFQVANDGLWARVDLLPDLVVREHHFGDPQWEDRAWRSAWGNRPTHWRTLPATVTHEGLQELMLAHIIMGG